MNPGRVFPFFLIGLLFVTLIYTNCAPTFKTTSDPSTGTHPLQSGPYTFKKIFISPSTNSFSSPGNSLSCPGISVNLNHQQEVVTILTEDTATPSRQESLEESELQGLSGALSNAAICSNCVSMNGQVACPSIACVGPSISLYHDDLVEHVGCLSYFCDPEKNKTFFSLLTKLRQRLDVDCK